MTEVSWLVITLWRDPHPNQQQIIAGALEQISFLKDIE